MTDKLIIDGVDVSEWTDEEVYYKFEKHSPKAIRQIAFDLYKQLKRKEKLLKSAENHIKDLELMVSHGEERENELEIKLHTKEFQYKELMEQWNFSVAHKIILEKDLKEEINQLKATNKYLKSKVKHYEQLLKLNITKLETAAESKSHADYLKSTGSILLVEENRKLKQTFIEIQKIVKPYQRNIDKICGHCRRYDGCHACCIDDITCYQYKSATNPACDKYKELKDFEINNLANQILEKISEVGNGQI